jgi:hypothetical protein
MSRAWQSILNYPLSIGAVPPAQDHCAAGRSSRHPVAVHPPGHAARLHAATSSVLPAPVWDDGSLPAPRRIGQTPFDAALHTIVEEEALRDRLTLSRFCGASSPSLCTLHVSRWLRLALGTNLLLPCCCSTFFSLCSLLPCLDLVVLPFLIPRNLFLLVIPSSLQKMRPPYFESLGTAVGGGRECELLS